MKNIKIITDSPDSPFEIYLFVADFRLHGGSVAAAAADLTVEALALARPQTSVARGAALAEGLPLTPSCTLLQGSEGGER